MLANRYNEYYVTALIKVYSTRIQSTECPNPLPFMCFTSSSSLNITHWDLLNDDDGKVFHGVPAPIEVFSHWFQDLLVSDVISVAIEADVQGILC